MIAEIRESAAVGYTYSWTTWLEMCREVLVELEAAQERIAALAAENTAMHETLSRIANKQAYPSPFYKWVKDQVRAPLDTPPT